MQTVNATDNSCRVFVSIVDIDVFCGRYALFPHTHEKHTTKSSKPRDLTILALVYILKPRNIPAIVTNIALLTTTRAPIFTTGSTAIFEGGEQ